jgi:hypothetical protein
VTTIYVAPLGKECAKVILCHQHVQIISLVTFACARSLDQKVTSAASPPENRMRDALLADKTLACVTFTQPAAAAPELRSQLESETEIKSFAAPPVDSIN